MKRFLTILSVLLVLAMLIPAWSLAESAAPEKIANGDVTLTIYIGMNANSAQFYTSYAEHPVVIEMMKQTGLNLEFVHPTGDTATFFNTTVASGDWPDMWRTSFNSYPGGAEAAIEDGILMNVNDLVTEYAPNFSALVEEKGLSSYIKADSGIIVNLGSTMQCPFTDNTAFRGMLVRWDLLEKYGLELPTTYDEWDALFAAFQQNGWETPMAFSLSNAKGQNFFSAGFGACATWMLDEGSVIYSPITEEYRDYLRLMADWYNKGYFNADSFTFSESDAQAELTAGNVAISTGHAGNMSKWNAAGVVIDPNFFVSGANAPRMNADDVLTLMVKNTPIGTGNPFFISATTEHPIECMKFFDYLYLPSTQQLTAWGTTGDLGIETFIYKDGVKTWGEFITNNPDGLDLTTARDRYSLNSFQIMWEQDMEVATYSSADKANALERFNYNTTREDRYPDFATMTVDETSSYTEIMSQIETYVDEMTQKFISGDASLDADWDAYVQQIEALNIDGAQAIKATSYERFINR